MNFSRAALSALALLAAARNVSAQSTQTYNGYTTQSDTSAMVALGVDQSTLEALINDNKDNDGAEQGFADGATLYTSGGTSSLVFQQLATNTDFFRSQQTGNFFASFQKYVDYFGGDETYMDVTCLAGFNGGDADFTAGGGDLWQYSVYDAFGRADLIEKATNYLIVFMMVQASLEQAIDSCQRGEAAASAIAYVDQAVAYWTGSEELPGPFFFNLGLARCENFGTCVNGQAPTNVMAWENFGNLRTSLAAESGAGDCSTSNASVQEIIAGMAVPLIQGTLRYAIFIGLDAVTDDKTKSEGAIFAQTSLPYIAACDATAAATIFDNMKPVAGIQTVDFDAVKAAFETTYDCLGITGADIGCYENRPETCPTGITASPTEATAVPEDNPAEAPTPSSTSLSAAVMNAFATTTTAIAMMGATAVAMFM